MNQQEFEQACAALVRDAQFIALAPHRLLKANLRLIEEAQAQIKIALAKAC